MPTDEDFKRGYIVAADGKITLLKPLSHDAFLDLANLYPSQLPSISSQQIELEVATPQPKSRSRQWRSPNGYIHLVAWSNACLLRILVTRWFYYFKSQVQSAQRQSSGSRGQSHLSSASPNPPYSPVISPNFATPTAVGGSALASDVSFNFPYSPLNSLNLALIGPKLLDRAEGQLDHLRSTVANIEEGYLRPTTLEYLTFLGYTQASLGEGKGDARRFRQDSWLASAPGSALADLGIDLPAWHLALKKSAASQPAQPAAPSQNYKGDYPGSTLAVPVAYSHASQRRDYGAGRNLGESRGRVGYSSAAQRQSFKGAYRTLEEIKGQNSLAKPVLPFSPNSPYSPVNSFKFDYPPVDNFNPAKLTYEILLELFNKTDWNLRQLVASLEDKLETDQKYYLVEQARLKGKVNWRR